MRSESARSSLQVGADDEDRRALRRRGEDLGVDRARRREIHPARRVRQPDRMRAGECARRGLRAVDAGDWIARSPAPRRASAGCPPRACARARPDRAAPARLDPPARLPVERAPVDEPPRREARELAEDEVVAHGRVEDEPLLAPVLVHDRERLRGRLDRSLRPAPRAPRAPARARAARSPRPRRRPTISPRADLEAHARAARRPTRSPLTTITGSPIARAARSRRPRPRRARTRP